MGPRSARSLPDSHPVTRVNRFMSDGQGNSAAGYGSDNNLLCDTAKKNGITLLHDDIAIDNQAVTLFLKHGFVEEYRTDEIIM